MFKLCRNVYFIFQKMLEPVLSIWNFSKFFPKLKADISHIEWKAKKIMKIGQVSCECLFNLVCALVRRSNVCLVLKIYGLFLLSAVEEK